MDKLINRPARQNRGIKIPQDGYLCCAAAGASGVSIWRSLSSDIKPDSFSVEDNWLSRTERMTREALLASRMNRLDINSMSVFSRSNKKSLCMVSKSFFMTQFTFILDPGIFLLDINYNYRAVILFLAQIHKSVIYVKKLTTRFDFTNRRSCHA
jgi:hypothetical protein